MNSIHIEHEQFDRIMTELVQVEERMPDWIHVPVSGCCNAYLTDAEADCGVCCDCRDACDVEIVSLAIGR